MPDTRDRPRTGIEKIKPPGYEPQLMWENAWAVCPEPDHRGGCDQGDGRRCNERDGSAWYNEYAAHFACRNGHVWTARTTMWEVETR